MPEFSAWVESTWISKTLFGISWLWPASESLHFIGLCMLIGGAGLLDLRLMGLFRGLAHPPREGADAVGDRRISRSTPSRARCS